MLMGVLIFFAGVVVGDFVALFMLALANAASNRDDFNDEY